jgi:hypothetical protein
MINVWVNKGPGGCKASKPVAKIPLSKGAAYFGGATNGYGQGLQMGYRTTGSDYKVKQRQYN